MTGMIWFHSVKSQTENDFSDICYKLFSLFFCFVHGRKLSKYLVHKIILAVLIKVIKLKLKFKIFYFHYQHIPFASSKIVSLWHKRMPIKHAISIYYSKIYFMIIDTLMESRCTMTIVFAAIARRLSIHPSTSSDMLHCFIRPSLDGTYYGMVMSVRPSGSPSVRLSVRPSGSPSASFPHFSPTCFDILSWSFTYDYILLYYRSSSSIINLRQFWWEFRPFWNLEYWKYIVFRTFLLPAVTYWAYICHIWLCFTVLQIKFEFYQFASIFVGVMPLLELRILEIHSFPHFSLTCFDILSWNFAYDFVLLYYRSSLSVVNLRQFLWKLCPFWNLEYWKYTVFHTFLLHSLTNWAEILHMTLLCCTTD